MERVTLSLLGAPRLERDGAPIVIDRRKTLALLGYLAVTGQPHTRDALAALLWPEAEQGRARANLRTALWTLESALAMACFETDRETVALRRELDLWLDVSEFRALVASCATHGHAEEDVCAACLAPLAEATALYAGDFLAGFTLRDTPAFDDWQLMEAERLRAALAGALERLARGYARQGAFAPALEFARRRLALDSLHEPAHQQLMRLHAWAGDRAAALRQYELCARALEAELGIEPSPETTALYEDIKANRLPDPLIERPGDWGTGGQAARNGSDAVEHRAPPVPRWALPVPLTPFVGREDELTTIKRLLVEMPECRLLTLLGHGGIGKTRLAIEAAALLRGAFAHGVCFVALEAVESPDLLTPTIAAALGFTFSGRRGPREQLCDYLAEKRLLLILDNFEHLLNGAILTTELLAAAPRLRILVTSRERLHVPGEWLLEVGGLGVPALNQTAELEAFSATRLFLQSARRSRPDFVPAPEEQATIVRICRTVGGMPLGIELAATWMRALSCSEIAAEIERDIDALAHAQRGVPPRHRSLRAVFDHSWQLLSEQERHLFAWLAVFRGSFTRAAAEALCAPEGTPILPVLAALIDKSLLRRAADGRFELLEVVRQYAAERLADTRDARVAHDSHSDYYTAFLSAQTERLKGAEQTRALEEIALEIEQARAAWRWAAQHARVEALAGAMESLFLFYETRSWFQEGAANFALAAEQLAAAGLSEPEPRRVLGMALVWQGRFAFHQSEYEPARALLWRGLELLRATGDQRGQALALTYLGYLGRAIQQLDEAGGFFRESLALFQADGDGWGAGQALNGLGVIAMDRGASQQAREFFEQSLARFRSAGYRRGIAIALTNLGNISFMRGRYPAAQRLFEESLPIFGQLGDRQGVSLVTNNLGALASVLGDSQESLRRYQESLALKRELGEPKATALTLNNLGDVSRELGELDVAEGYLREAVAITTRVGDRWIAARALNNLGLTATRRGDQVAAWEHFAQALRIAAETRVEPSILDVVLGIATWLRQAGQPERSRDLLAFAARQAALEESQRARAHSALAELDAQLDQHSIAASGARAATMTYETVLAELLAQPRKEDAQEHS